MAESEEELKSLLMSVKEENEKAGLKLNIKKNKKQNKQTTTTTTTTKTKIMASSPISTWQIEREKL